MLRVISGMFLEHFVVKDVDGRDLGPNEIKIQEFGRPTEEHNVPKGCIRDNDVASPDTYAG